MQTCPKCQHQWEVIDLTKDDDSTTTHADDTREVLVLDSQQPNREGGARPSSPPTIEPQHQVSRIPERGWTVGDLPSAGIRRIRFAGDSEASEASDIEQEPYRTPSRQRRASTRLLYERGWAPRRTVGVRRIFRYSTNYVPRRAYRSHTDQGTY